MFSKVSMEFMEKAKADNFFFSFSEWESSILKKKIVSLKIEGKLNEKRNKKLSGYIKELEKFKPLIISCRVRSLDLPKVSLLEENGFNLIECYLELKNDLSQKKVLSNGVKIEEFCQKNNLKDLEGIAESSLLSSRFHLDSKIEKKIATKTRVEWIKNSCNGRANVVFVSIDGGSVKGFLSVMLKDMGGNKVGTIDLLAVDVSFRRGGSGSGLINTFLSYCEKNNCDYAIVGTQSVNISALRFYQKNNFYLNDSFYTLHKHL